jgi:hypothetical protein
VTRYRWVDSRRAEGFLVTLPCAVARVSSTAFYAWLAATRHGPTGRDLGEAYLVNAIITVHRGSDDTYGVPRIAAQLRHDGWVVNRKRIERLMRQYGIVGVHKARKLRTTIPAEDNPPIPDLIGRGFAPGRPDVACCGDITYIRTGEGWLYLAGAGSGLTPATGLLDGLPHAHRTRRRCPGHSRRRPRRRRRPGDLSR